MQSSRTDFPSAATRHLRDASLLLTAGRFDNARYLAGYVAECSGKAVVAAAGLIAERYGHDLPKLRRDGLDLALLISPTFARYAPSEAAWLLVRHCWSEQHRYLKTHLHKETADRIVLASTQIWLATIGAMVLDGVFELPE